MNALGVICWITVLSCVGDVSRDCKAAHWGVVDHVEEQESRAGVPDEGGMEGAFDGKRKARKDLHPRQRRPMP